ARADSAKPESASRTSAAWRVHTIDWVAFQYCRGAGLYSVGGRAHFLVPGEARQFRAVLRDAINHLRGCVDIVLDRLFNRVRNPITNSGGGFGVPYSSLGSLVSGGSDFS